MYEYKRNESQKVYHLSNMSQLKSWKYKSYIVSYACKLFISKVINLNLIFNKDIFLIKTNKIFMDILKTYT